MPMEKEKMIRLTRNTIYIVIKRENADELAQKLNSDIHALVNKAMEEGASGQYFVTSPAQNRKNKKET